MTGVLVLVTGTGRSGTSTISGTLHHLGLHVPGPYLGANDSNPKGFFESSWAVSFHKEVCAAAGIDGFDSRPTALQRVQDALTPELRARLVEFLREHASSPQVVVKDPRSVWVQRLWKEAAAEVDLEIRYLSMLRHPAEVVGSRTTYYASRADEVARLRYETINVARWVNSSLVSERETRGEMRAFVPYTELLDDWRPVLSRVADELGLTLNSDLSTADHHPVDDFIDPGLRRHQVTWDDLDAPQELRDVAQQVWDQQLGLCRSHGVDTDASTQLDRLGERYSRILTEAAAISHDTVEEARRDARRAGAREERTRMARKRAAARHERPLEDRPLRDIGGRDLLREAARRAVRRLRRS